MRFLNYANICANYRTFANHSNEWFHLILCTLSMLALWCMLFDSHILDMHLISVGVLKLLQRYSHNERKSLWQGKIEELAIMNAWDFLKIDSYHYRISKVIVNEIVEELLLGFAYIVSKHFGLHLNIFIFVLK